MELFGGNLMSMAATIAKGRLFSPGVLPGKAFKLHVEVFMGKRNAVRVFRSSFYSLFM